VSRRALARGVPACAVPVRGPAAWPVGRATGPLAAIAAKGGASPATRATLAATATTRTRSFVTRYLQPQPPNTRQKGCWKCAARFGTPAVAQAGTRAQSPKHAREGG
jgi:hypothetical protein